MAYINVHDWKCEQVTEWLKGQHGVKVINHQFQAKISFFKGIEFINKNYLSAFSNNFWNGSKLLNIRPYELNELGIKKIGHQEVILEAIEHLKNFVS